MTRFTALLVFFITALAHGADDISSILAADGKVDEKKMQQYIDWVDLAIHEYPTHFKDEDEKKRIMAATTKVTEEIKSLNPDKLQDVNLVTSLAYILAMGHNADLRTFPYARAFYERALALDPENTRANYLYGMFLISTERYHYDSVPYLQKALALGERDAQFSLAMLYYQKGDKVKALQEMEAYAAARPKDYEVREVIKTMKDGTLQFGSAPMKPKGK